MLQSGLLTNGIRKSQDCLVLKVAVDASQCHTGRQSCFYRALKKDSDKEMEFIAEKIYSPKEVYEEQSENKLPPG